MLLNGPSCCAFTKPGGLYCLVQKIASFEEDFPTNKRNKNMSKIQESNHMLLFWAFIYFSWVGNCVGIARLGLWVQLGRRLRFSGFVQEKRGIYSQMAATQRSPSLGHPAINRILSEPETEPEIQHHGLICIYHPAVSQKKIPIWVIPYTYIHTYAAKEKKETKRKRNRINKQEP